MKKIFVLFLSNIVYLPLLFPAAAISEDQNCKNFAELTRLIRSAYLNYQKGLDDDRYSSSMSFIEHQFKETKKYHFLCASRLLSAHAPIHFGEQLVKSALMEALRCNNDDLAKLLLQHGAPIINPMRDDFLSSHNLSSFITQEIDYRMNKRQELNEAMREALSPIGKTYKGPPMIVFAYYGYLNDQELIQVVGIRKIKKSAMCIIS